MELKSLGRSSGGGGSSTPGTVNTITLNAVCQVTDLPGMLVSVQPQSTESMLVVAKTDIFTGPYLPAIAVLFAKLSPTTCTILRFGVFAEYSGLITSARYFAGPDGYPASVFPTNKPPYYLQHVGVATSDSALLVLPSADYKRKVTSL